MINRPKLFVPKSKSDGSKPVDVAAEMQPPKGARPKAHKHIHNLGEWAHPPKKKGKK